MITYNFAEKGPQPLYEYLYKCIKNDIIAGKIKAGEKLPSKRAFAKNLGISVITVEGAYSMLVSEGYVYSIPKKGFYVADFSFPAAPIERAKAAPAALSGGEGAFLADFTSPQTDTEIFPFSVWTKAMRDVMAQYQKELMTNPPCGGILRLRRAIAEYLLEFRGMQADPEQIMIGAGTEYLYSILIQLLGRSCVYAIEDPGYHKSAKICEQFGLPCVYINMDDSGIIVSELEEKGATLVHTSPAHHFPTGAVMPLSRRYELLSWALKAPGRYLIEDEYDSELRMDGRPLPTLKSIDVSGRVIYMNTFAKTLCSTVRISYMVLPEELTDLFYKKLGFYSCTVSNFEQYALAAFIENGSFEKHINRLRNFYRKKRDLLLEAISKSPLSEKAQILEKESGAHFLMKINTALPEEDVLKRARTKKIRLGALSSYYSESCAAPENIYVMNYSSVKAEDIEEAVRRIYESV